MIVEMIGPPGVGKTTAMGRLDELAQNDDLPLLGFDDYQTFDRECGQAAIMKRYRLNRWLVLSAMLWRRPRLVASVMTLALLHGRPFLRRIRKAERVVAHVLFSERLKSHFPDKICIHHDGFTQCLWSMLVGSRELRGKSLIRRLLHDYYGDTNMRVVLLEVDDSVAAERAFSRISKGRFNRDSSPKTRTEFGRWLDYHRQIVELLPVDRNVVRIDAGTSPSDVAANVLTALRGAPALDETT